MSRTILIGSYPGSPWLADCLRSIPTGFEVIVYASGGFELGALRWMHTRTNVESFLFLHDSVQVRNPAWLEALDWSRSIALLGCPSIYGSFLGVYQRRILDRIGVPATPTKREAVSAEHWWTQQYVAADPSARVLFEGLADCNRFDARHGRKVMVIENEHIVKFKSCWNIAMIGDYEKNLNQPNQEDRKYTDSPTDPKFV